MFACNSRGYGALKLFQAGPIRLFTPYKRRKRSKRHSKKTKRNSSCDGASNGEESDSGSGNVSKFLVSHNKDNIFSRRLCTALSVAWSK